MDKKSIDGLDFSPVLKAMKDEDLDALVAMEPHSVAFLLNYWNEILVQVGFREAPAAVVITSSGDIFAVTVRMNYNREIAPWVSDFVGRYTDSAYYDQGRMVETLVQALKKRASLGEGSASRRVLSRQESWIGSKVNCLEQKLWMENGSCGNFAL